MGNIRPWYKKSVTDQRTSNEVSTTAPDSAARALLAACATSHGLLASTVDALNYKRVWARDGLIAAIGAVAGGLVSAEDWLERTLGTLANAQGPAGQIPSNVTRDDEPKVSYGTAALRIDATLWFLVGAGILARRRPLSAMVQDAVPRARALLRAWEGNERGLLYVPRAGNWADEYPVHGYTLYDNVLRLWAEDEALQVAPDDAAESHRAKIETAITSTFFAKPPENPGVPFVPAFVAPGEKSTRQCTLGLALAGMLFEPNAASDVGRHAVATLRSVAAATDGGALLPAYTPVIVDGDAEWPTLVALADYGFRNAPGRYHNGGLWPMVNGFVAAAFRAHGDDDGADAVSDAIRTANARYDFPEYLDANTGEGAGTRRMAWSASAEFWATASAASFGRRTR